MGNGEDKKYRISEVAAATGMDVRTIRFYIQKGVIDRPYGPKGNGAYYTRHHLDQLMGLRKWKNAGLSLDRIQEIVKGVPPEKGSLIPPPRPKRQGDVELWSRVWVSDGVELHIEPKRSGLTPQQVRDLADKVLESQKDVLKNDKDN